MIDKPPEENMQDSEMNQVEKKEVIKQYDKIKKYFDWSDKTLITYKDKEKIEYEIEIISTSAN